MDKKKDDCKYWDKCYQKNSEHHAKYNHPPATVATGGFSPAKNADSDASSPNKTGRSPQKRTPSPRRKSPDRKTPPKRSPRDPEVEQRSPKRPRKSPTPAKSPKTNTSGDTSSNYLKVEEELSSSNRSPSPRQPKSPLKRSPSPKKRTESPMPTTSPKRKESSLSKLDSSGPRSSPERREMDITKEYNEVIENLSKAYQIEPAVIRFSQKAEYLELLRDPRKFIKHMFLVEMPPDFYKFWEFCEKQAKSGIKPQAVFEKVGLKLVGPFDCLAGNFHKAKLVEPGEYLRHWRFFYDPPEFQTVFVKDKSEIHYGYWRDDPQEKQHLLMARNDSSKGCEFDFVGANCFETVLYFLDKDSGLTPFNRHTVTALKKSLEEFAKENEISLTGLVELKKKRDRKVVCKLFHKAGLVVPFDRKSEVGYRGMIESEAKLKKILGKFWQARTVEGSNAPIMEELQPFITAANIAVDECDFGTAIELGIDMFCSGHKELHGAITGLLVNGYSMVKRPQFIAIIKTHLEGRKEGSDLSILG